MAAAATFAELGRLDILINNSRCQHRMARTTRGLDNFRQTPDFNSVAAHQIATAYAASNSGLIGLTRDLARQWAERRGIRVNALALGFVAIDINAERPEQTLDRFLDTDSLPRLGTQREMAVALFLASPASRYVTGITLAIDGGMSGH